MKVLHLAVTSQASGIARQMEFERAACKREGIALTTKHWVPYSESGHAEVLPFVFRGPLGRRFVRWLLLFSYLRSNDLVLARHIGADPFVFLFAIFSRRRCDVYHSKTELELLTLQRGLLGKLASGFERFTRPIFVKTALVSIGVTDEISEHLRSAGAKRVITLPNGIDYPSTSTLADKRASNELGLFFMSSQFSEWQGLEEVLFGLSAYNGKVREQFGVTIVRLHLVGELDQAQQAAIDKINTDCKDVQIVMWGHLPEEDFREVMANCHCGLSAFGLHKKGLTEASTLKVREMLASGLPVYSGHKDSAFSVDFKYYTYGSFDLIKVFQFYALVKKSDRLTVRRLSMPYIDKAAILQRALSELEAIEREV